MSNEVPHRGSTGTEQAVEPDKVDWKSPIRFDRGSHPEWDSDYLPEAARKRGIWLEAQLEQRKAEDVYRCALFQEAERRLGVQDAALKLAREALENIAEESRRHPWYGVVARKALAAIKAVQDE